MSSATPSPVDTEGDGFVQQNASAWIVFDPSQVGGHRRDVRSAAAKSSATARKATIARKLALNTDCSNDTDGTATSSRPGPASKKRRRKDIEERSPVRTAPPNTFGTRTQSEISLVSMTNSSTLSSGSGSPCWELPQMPATASPPTSPVKMRPKQSEPPSAGHVPLQNHEAWQAASFILGLDSSYFAKETSVGPTQFGASRVRTMTIDNIHSAISAGRTSKGMLLSIGLLAAWGRRFGDERYCQMHVRVWYALARRREMLPAASNEPGSVDLSIPQIVLLSLQSFFNLNNVIDDTAASSCFAHACAAPAAPSGRQIVRFFDLLGDLVVTDSDI